jgi:hypothetical protein
MFTLMALGTQRLQRPEAESIPVAAVVHNMIGDLRDHDQPFIGAQAAEGMTPELVERSAAPTP